MKTQYEEDPHFHKFIKQAVTLSSLVDLKDVLKDLNLDSLLRNFESEGVDLDLLITLDKAEIKDSLKEIGVKRFGDRHKLCERILVEKRSRSDRTPDDNQKQDTVVNDEPSLVEANHLDQSKGPFENTESLLVNDDDTFGNIEETEHESEHID